MKVLYKSKTGEITIKLTHNEARQFLSSESARNVVAKAIQDIKEFTDTSTTPNEREKLGE